MGTNASSAVWIVIPAFNEGEVIRSVVADVHSHYKNVVVVDDCSSDNTGSEALEAGAFVLRHPVNLGQGASLQTGLLYALRHGADYLVTFDADGQHRTADIAVLMVRQKETGADVVVGSRFLGSVSNMPMLRRLLLRLAVIFMRLTTGVPLTDAHNGLRLFTRKAAARIKIHQNRMAHASELVHQFKLLKLRVAEAPVTIIYTDYSLRKGQRLSNAVNIVAELFVGRLTR